MIKEQIIQELRNGAILHRSDYGASSWCHLECSDGTTYALSELYSLDKDIRLKPIKFDNRGVPTQYSWEEKE
jgi:hypothetical protein